MASAFSHIAIPAVMYIAFRSDAVNWRLFLIAAFLSIAPDLDVLAFKLGIDYASQWGHRGFTHSLFFAICISAVMTLFHPKLKSTPPVIFTFCFLSCASHAILDALTNGGLGVALYWPFSAERVFLPSRPIQVSPIGIASFFSEKGLRVMASELQWVLMPALGVSFVAAISRYICAKKT